MKVRQDFGNPGHTLGFEAVDHIVERAEQYCECEQQRIEAANEPEIIALRAELSLLLEHERDLRERARMAPPLGDIRGRRRQSFYYWSVTLTLALAGFFFTLLALDPYRLGWKSYLYASGIAIVSPFCLDRFLESWGSLKLIRALSALSAVAALASLMLLALVRGDVLSRQIKDASPVVVLEGETPTVQQAQGDFYDATLPRLRVLMALLALALEIGAGLALHNALRLSSDSGGDPDQIRRELAAVHELMVSRLHHLSVLQNEPAVFVSRFWRDFYRAMLNGTMRRALTKLSIIVIAIFLGIPNVAAGAQPLNLVVAVDLTKSVATSGPDQRTEFEKNLLAVTQLLAQLPAGSRVSVLGITDQSFARPFVLLTARMSEDEGYFKERLAAARGQIVGVWAKRRKELKPEFSQSDVLGALIVAAHVFEQASGDRKVLVMFSDMRHSTPDLDIERAARIHVRAALDIAENKGLVASLPGVEVYALGVDGSGKTVAYWETLREFWTEYFRRSGARLKVFSVRRELPQLESAAGK